MTVWEATQHLIERLEAQGDEAIAGLLRALEPPGSPAQGTLL